MGRRPQITPSEVARYRRDGYLVVDHPIVTPRHLGRVHASLDGLFARARELPAGWVHDLAPVSEPGHVPELINCAHLEPRLFRTMAYRRSLRAAQRLIGRPVHLAFDHAIFKPPGAGAPTALHQDLAFEPDWDVPTATIWLALTDATEENGCMRFLPRTPAGLLEHEAVGRDGRGVVGLGIDAAAPCPVPAGGCTVHTQRAVHGSGPNRTDAVRAAWILKFERDDRSWRRHGVDRLLELLGVATSRRAREMRTATADRQPRTDVPGWVEDGPSGGDRGGHGSGRAQEAPSGEDRAKR